MLKRFNTIAKGASITHAGNTIALSQAPNNLDSIGALITTNSALQAGPAYPFGTTTNWQQDSSTAILNLPPGATILYAELVWSYTSVGVNGIVPSPAAAPAQPVSFSGPFGTQLVAPDPTTSVDTPDPTAPRRIYSSRSAVVTSLVGASPNEPYTVGAVPAVIDLTDTGTAVGWSLIVVYSNPAIGTLRDVNLFVGNSAVGAGVNGPIVNISGFKVPTAGPVSAHISISTLEGDSNKGGDQFRFLGGTAPITALSGANALSGPNNPINNFFASQINYGNPPDPGLAGSPAGALNPTGTFGALNQPVGSIAPGRRQGWDITNVDASAQLHNGDTNAGFQGTTSGDAYVITVTGIQIDVFQPSLRIAKSSNGPWASGQTAPVPTYTLDVANAGTAPTVGASTVLDQLPAGISADIAAPPFTGPVNGWTCTDSATQLLTCTHPAVIPQTAPGNAVPFTVPVIIGPAATGFVTNYASVGSGGDFFNGGAPPAPGPSCTDPTHCASLPTQILTREAQVIKSVQLTTNSNGIGIPTPGDTLTWTVALSNTGSAPLAGAQITDALPANTTIVPGSARLVSATPGVTPPAAVNGGFNGSTITTLLIPGSTLPTNGTIVVSYQVTINAGFKGVLQNRATGSATGLSPVDSSAADNATTGLPAGVIVPAGSLPQGPDFMPNTGPPIVGPTQVNVVVPEATLLKAVELSTDVSGTGSPSPGDTLTWTVFYANTGSAPLPAVQIADALPADTTIVPGSARIVSQTGTSVPAVASAGFTGVAPNANLLANGNVTLANDGVIAVSFQVTIDAGFTGTIANRATGTARGLPPAGIPSNAIDTATTGLPTGVVPRRSSIPQGPGGTPNSGNPINGPTQVVVTTPTASGIKAVALTTDADGNGVLTPGDTLTWTIGYRNDGTIPIFRAQINDPLPTNTTIVPGSVAIVASSIVPAPLPNQAYNGTTNTTLLLNPVTIPAGGTVEVSFRVTLNAGDTAPSVDRAALTGARLPPAGIPSRAVDATTTNISPGLTVPAGSLPQGRDGTPNNGPPLDAPTIATPATIALVGIKSVQLTTDADGNGVPSPGDTLTWTISYVNTGSANIPGTQITDTLPANTTIVPGSATVVAASNTAPAAPIPNAAYTGAGGATNLVNAPFTVAPAGYVTVSFRVTINAGFVGTLLDTALAAGRGLPPSGVPTSAVDNSTTGIPNGVIVPPGSIDQGPGGTPNTGPPIVGPVKVPVTASNPSGIKSVQLTIDADGNGVPSAGDTLTWTIAYANSGASLAGAQITDPLPTGSAIVPGSAAIVSSSGVTSGPPIVNKAYDGAANRTLLAAPITLSATGTVVVSFRTTINGGVSAPLVNRAVLNGNGLPAGGIPTNAVDGTTTGLPAGLTVPSNSIPQGPGGQPNAGPPINGPTTVTPLVPAAAVIKSVRLTGDVNGTGVPAPGDTLTWTVSYANTGSAPISAAQLSDTLPATLTIVPASATLVSQSGATPAAVANAAFDGAANKTLVGNAPTLAARGVITVSFRTTINAGASGTLNNSAIGGGGGTPPGGVPSAAGDSTTTSLPPGVVIPPGSVPQGPGGAGNTGPPIPGPTHVTLVPPAAVGLKSVQLTTDADGNGVLTPGDTLTWTITYVNSATVAIPNSQITDTLDPNTTLVKGSETVVASTGVAPAPAANAAFDGSAAKNLLVSPVTIASGGSITLSFRVTLDAGVTTQVTDRALLNGTGLPAAGVPTSAVDNGTTGLPPGVVVPPNSLPQGPGGKPTTGPPLAAPTFAVPATIAALGVKSVAVTGGNAARGAAPGNVLTWTIAYGNTGTAPIANAQIADTLPEHTTFVPGSVAIASSHGVTPAPAASVTYNGAATKTLLANSVTLAPAALIVVNFSVTVDAGFTGTILNRAILNGSGLPAAGIPTGAADPSTTGLPPGFTVPPGSIPQGPNGQPNSGPPINNNTSVNSTAPALSPLLVQKSVDREVASSGDRLIYTIVATNPNNVALGLTTIVDNLPGGVAYANGSTRIDGVPAPDPIKAGSTLSWSVSATAAKGQHTVVFATVIAPGIPVGTILTNTANANAKVPGTNTTLASGNTQAQTRVIGGIFNDCVTILGRVFVNHDDSGRFGRDDVGIPNVRIYLESGEYVTTDRYGKYNFACVRPGMHVLRLDTLTLPPGTAPYNVRNYDDPRSVQRLAHGTLDAGLIQNINFAIRGAP